MTFLRDAGSAALVAFTSAGCARPPQTAVQTPVRFFSDDEPTQIIVRTRRTDRFVAKCMTPCSLDLWTGDYEIKALATESSPRAVTYARIDRPKDILVRSGSKTGEDVGLALAIPSTVLLPVVTIATIFECWPYEDPNRDDWCDAGTIGGSFSF